MNELRKKLVEEYIKNNKKINELENERNNISSLNVSLSDQFVKTAKYKVDQIISVKNQTDAYISTISCDLSRWGYNSSNVVQGQIKYALKCMTMSGEKGERHHSGISEEDLDARIKEGEYKLIEKATAIQFKKAVYANWPKILEPVEIQVLRESPDKGGSVQYLVTVQVEKEKRYLLIETSKSSYDYMHPRISVKMQKDGYGKRDWHIRVYANSNGEPCFKIYKFCTKKYSEETWRNFTFMCISEEDILEHCLKAI